MKYKAIVLHPRDNVATSIAEIQKYDEFFTKAADDVINCKVTEDIPFGHKFSLVEIDSGMNVIKYGYPIGRSTRKIGKGAHVHVHNLTTRQEENIDGFQKT